MKLVAENTVETFLWADWIDAAMGSLKGVDGVYDAKEEINWRARTPSKCDLSRPLLTIQKDHPELPELPGDIRVWTGWPLFDIKVVQIEINQWMQAAGFMHGFGEVVRPEVEWWSAEVNTPPIRFALFEQTQFVEP